MNVVNHLLRSAVLFVCLAVCSWAADAQRAYKVSVGFYNVENLFDTIDNENNDEDFLPNGSYGWTDERYQMKLANMAYAISKMAGDKAPDVLGLCEVENRNVLEDLVAHPLLAPLNYQIVHYDSPDRRGIDVALLYRPSVFTFTGSNSHTVVIPGEEHIKTRDILEVGGSMLGERINLFVGHWPSRAGGEQVSLNRRMTAAKLMRSLVDSIANEDKESKFILMGDFNDDPTSPSLTQGLRTINDKKLITSGSDLFNTMASLHKSGYGTLAYQDVWNLFDHIIVSANMIDSKHGLRVQYNKATNAYGRIYNASFLTQQTGHYKGYPFRTTSNGKFQNGYSDHYPVYIYLVKEVK